MASGALFPRMLRAAKVESQLYEEVEADSGATGQALSVVVMASLSAGIGHGISSVRPERNGGHRRHIGRRVQTGAEEKRRR